MNELIALMRERINYNPETGLMTYTNRAKGGRATGEKVGTPEKHGYIKVNFQGKKYLAHRLIWMMFYGRPANGMLDHINGIRTDNRIANLRECTPIQNSANSKAINNRTGYRGVVALPSGKFAVQLRRDGRSTYRGCFDTKEQAGKHYQQIHAEQHGEFSPYFNMLNARPIEAQRAQAQEKD